MSKGVDLNLGNAINWDRVLNRGKVAWWLSHPSLPHGNTWMDLAGLSNRNGNNGTLTNGPIWGGPKGRPGGYGSLSFDGVNDIVSVPTISTVSKSLTFGAWVRPANTSADMIFLSAVGQNTYLRCKQGVWMIKIDTTQTPSSVAYSTNTWYRVVGTYDGANARMYVNGSLAYSFAESAASPTALPWRMGDFGGSGLPYAGSMDDVFIANRVWSAAEVALDYEQSRTGHPDTLNWISP